MNRARLRDLGIGIGDLPTGPHNAITDVPDVWVGHHTLIYDEPRVARTGVTMVVPRANQIWEDYAFAAWHSFNGNGEMTGLPWLEESGMLGSAIGITNTHQVGVVRDALVRYSEEQGYLGSFILPVVAETYDGWLNDINAFHVTGEHALTALKSARPGPVAEGGVGGGTGMICHGFKGGIGTSSRMVEVEAGRYTVGVLVQANYGRRQDLRIDGVPVGRSTLFDDWPDPYYTPKMDGSIIVIIATDAPLLPMQCKRLAQRATVGLARAGGTGHNGSGDIFLAFATGNHLPKAVSTLRSVRMVPHNQMDLFFHAVADATEESILNALCAAETMTGFHGRTVHALPLEALKGA
ncbi:MAG: P1 family peptidase [Chloroflexota bacterium]